MDGTRWTVFRPAAVLAAALAAACGGADAETAQSDAAHVVACSLISVADAEAILGPLAGPPEPREMGNGSTCSIVGAAGAVLLRAYHPYYGGEPSSGAWAARLEEERREEAADESDPELRKMLEQVRIAPFEGLGVPAALEDLREHFDQVALHAVKGGKGGTFISVYAPNAEIARAIAVKALANIA